MLFTEYHSILAKTFVESAPVSEKIIHFGEFVRWNRIKSGKSTEDLARELGLTSRRVIAIESMNHPEVQHTTVVALGRAFGMEPEEFEHAWKSTPVPVTRRKRGPTTDEARVFNRACAVAGITPLEGLRRLRSWIVAQDEKTLNAALHFIPPHRAGIAQADSMFTDPVDHLQDPAEAARLRIGRQAASSARSPESDATSENKHR